MFNFSMFENSILFKEIISIMSNIESIFGAKSYVYIKFPTIYLFKEPVFISWQF